MPETFLLHHLIAARAQQQPDAPALTYGPRTLHYGPLQGLVERCGSGLQALGIDRGERVGIYLEKRFETVVASFGTTAAGAVFVPLNPLLKADQVGHILRDCNIRILVTSPERLASLHDVLAHCPDVDHVVLTGDPLPDDRVLRFRLVQWEALLQDRPAQPVAQTDGDIAAILYTSGSTGRPKGVVLSHRNMVAGAKSVASYLGNHSNDTLLAALPLSFDAGFSQLTTAFHAGARVVLLNYLMPRDVLNVLVRERVTGLTAVPPLYMQLTQLEWPTGIDDHLRYFANTGGRMPLETLNALRARAPKAKPFLMYGLTEAFRATYLPPEEVDCRPDSIGKAIPNNEVLVLREDGSPCDAGEPGELVQRGPLVAQGYWNDVEKTAERFRPLPAAAGARPGGLVMQEIAVFSGDTVRRDSEGYLYFIGRRDEMIKTSGYRVSPTEIEEALYATGHVGECAAFGVDHDTLGQAIVVIVTPKAGGTLDETALLADCRRTLPAYQVPARIVVEAGPLPRNPNGKIDRKALSASFATL
jgi:acyl-CoA ligase (AMP-forming) (exosortase A-associated)